MDNNILLKNVVSLFESTSLREEQYSRQQKIVDSGSDVLEDPLEPDIDKDRKETQKKVKDQNSETMENSGDENPLSDNEGDSFDQNLELEPSKFEDEEKLFKLFDFIKNIKEKSTELSKKLEEIDSELIDENQKKQIGIYINKFKMLTDKISSYLSIRFENQAYEEALYVYILYRTEFLNNIKNIQDILELYKKSDENGQK